MVVHFFSKACLSQRKGWASQPSADLQRCGQALLGRYSRSEDVVVGTPLANRTRPELEGLIGYFVNTVALRTDLSGVPPLRPFTLALAPAKSSPRWELSRCTESAACFDHQAFSRQALLPEYRSLDNQRLHCSTLNDRSRARPVP